MWSLDVRNQFARIAIAIAFIPSELQYLTGQLLHALVMGSRGVTIYRSVLLVVLASFAVELAAEGFGLTGSKQVNDRPDASGPPTEVNIGIYLLDIYDIDDVNQAFSVDLLFYVRWHDPRLALPENERAGWNRRIPLEDIWTPRLLVVNDRGLTPQLPLVAEIDDLGNVYARQRAYGKLSANLLFEDFPFDAQHLPIRIVSHGYSPRDLRFSLDDEFRSDLGSFSAEGWSFRILGSRFDAVPMPDSDEGWARLTYSIEAQRNSRYYILTVFLPVSLIVIMSWLVFWLPPDVIPSRVGISTASSRLHPDRNTGAGYRRDGQQVGQIGSPDRCAPSECMGTRGLRHPVWTDRDNRFGHLVHSLTGIQCLHRARNRAWRMSASRNCPLPNGTLSNHWQDSCSTANGRPRAKFRIIAGMLPNPGQECPPEKKHLTISTSSGELPGAQALQSSEEEYELAS
jgi:hypothetical protein